MAYARGKVVGGKVEVEGQPLPEGSTVIVWVDEAEGFDVGDEDRAALEAADAEIERGNGVTLEELAARLRAVRPP